MNEPRVEVRRMRKGGEQGPEVLTVEVHEAWASGAGLESCDLSGILFKAGSVCWPTSLWMSTANALEVDSCGPHAPGEVRAAFCSGPSELLSPRSLNACLGLFIQGGRADT